MKIENRTRTITQNYSVYVAEDGTEFNTKKECEAYEKLNVNIDIEGIEWFDEDFNKLPLRLYFWNKVKYIRFANADTDIALSDFLNEFTEEFDGDGYDRYKMYQNTNIFTTTTEYTIYYDEDENEYGWRCLEKEWEKMEKAVNKFILNREG